MTFNCGFPVSRELTAFVPDLTRNKAACGAKKTDKHTCKVEKGRNGFLPTWSGIEPLPGFKSQESIILADLERGIRHTGFQLLCNSWLLARSSSLPPDFRAVSESAGDCFYGERQPSMDPLIAHPSRGPTWLTLRGSLFCDASLPAAECSPALKLITQA